MCIRNSNDGNCSNNRQIDEKRFSVSVESEKHR